MGVSGSSGAVGHPAVLGLEPHPCPPDQAASYPEPAAPGWGQSCNHSARLKGDGGVGLRFSQPATHAERAEPALTGTVWALSWHPSGTGEPRDNTHLLGKLQLCPRQDPSCCELEPGPSQCPNGTSTLLRTLSPQRPLPSTLSPCRDPPVSTGQDPGAALPKALAMAMVSSRPMSGTTASPTPMSWEGRIQSGRAGTQHTQEGAEQPLGSCQHPPPPCSGRGRCRWALPGRSAAAGMLGGPGGCCQ